MGSTYPERATQLDLGWQGYKLILRTDQENAIKVVADAVKAGFSGDISLEESVKGDLCNGYRAKRTTPFQRLKSWTWQVALPSFEERGSGLLQASKEQNGCQMAGRDLLGLRHSSSEKIIGTRSGILVAQSIRKKPDDKQFSLEGCKGDTLATSSEVASAADAEVLPDLAKLERESQRETEFFAKVHEAEEKKRKAAKEAAAAPLKAEEDRDAEASSVRFGANRGKRKGEEPADEKRVEPRPAEASSSRLVTWKMGWWRLLRLNVHGVEVAGSYEELKWLERELNQVWTVETRGILARTQAEKMDTTPQSEDETQHYRSIGMRIGYLSMDKLRCLKGLPGLVQMIPNQEQLVSISAWSDRAEYYALISTASTALGEQAMPADWGVKLSEVKISEVYFHSLMCARPPSVKAGLLDSYMLDITIEVVKARDSTVAGGRDDGETLLSRTMDKTDSKGTGLWSVVEALQALRNAGMSSVTEACESATAWHKVFVQDVCQKLQLACQLGGCAGAFAGSCIIGKANVHGTPRA
ncbi:GND [Symbiodinium sp. CCMP2456]|nr:GND [Symbiodinium sp. CCMP2456]